MAETVYDKTLARRTISPAVLTTGTVNGDAVDRAAAGGAEEALVVVITGTITDGTHTVAIQDSNDGTTGWANVPAAQLQGTPPAIGAANDDTLYEVGVSASRRYLRVAVTTVGATTGGVLGAVVVLGDVRQVPVTH